MSLDLNKNPEYLLYKNSSLHRPSLHSAIDGFVCVRASSYL